MTGETTTDPPPPLAIGQRLMLMVEDLAFGGEGVGRTDEFVVFVPFVIPGETVEVEITEVKKRFARAKALRVAKPSAHRVQPACRYFGACGGCQYQHMDYAHQLEWKRKQIADLLQRIGSFPAAVIDPVAPSPKTLAYRNRIMVRSQWNKATQSLVIGFLSNNNRFVVDLDACAIAEPALNEQLADVRAQPPPKGGLKVTLRLAPEGWEMPRDSFFQTNFFLLPKLVETVRDCVRQGGARNLVDAYCGVGFFSIECADLVPSFLGVEVDLLAVRAARNNAATRNIRNGEYLCARTEDLLPDILHRFPAAQTVLILDPPRTGCPPASLELLKQARLAQIIYVSCHPATLARDLNILCGEGVFELIRLRPLDMFPHTQHVECVADLRLKGTRQGQA
jgi:tRNA/tmRNA/rRNA uracil-C5-methylase (TrmA/RlmC/RlmD family)